ncbi:V [Murine mastadenovirus A]|uniref:Core-capsid bridging protein n=1 Tax=Murine adenovirus A serotype 1 TaxID=10530 RepID=CORE5_ADEM1|nr:minor core protein [Murine mastadenovirus A]AP_000348.1 V [Murine mastadenovirus A]O10442.1 RecName: Full=Core-capsid bridging protein; AltName: Full=Core protein V [Murine adenovirus 1]AAB53757.1 V [Murine adenovirus 1] [Murine adenovirus 1]
MEDSRVYLDRSNATPSYIPVTPQIPVPGLGHRRVKREHVQVDEEPTVQILIKRPKVEDEEVPIPIFPPLPPARDPVAAVAAAGGQIVRRRRRRVPGTAMGVDTVDVVLPVGVRYHPSIEAARPPAVPPPRAVPPVGVRYHPSIEVARPPAARISPPRRRRRRRRSPRPRATAAYRSSAEVVERRRRVAQTVPVVRYHPSIQVEPAVHPPLAPRLPVQMAYTRYHPTIH